MALQTTDDLRGQTLSIPTSVGTLAFTFNDSTHFTRNNHYDVLNMNVGRNSNGYAWIYGSRRKYEYRVWDYEFSVSQDEHRVIELIVRRYQLFQEALNLHPLEYDAGTNYSPGSPGTVGAIVRYNDAAVPTNSGYYLYTGAAGAGNAPSNAAFWERAVLSLDDRLVEAIEEGPRTRPLAAGTTETALAGLGGVAYFARWYCGIASYRATKTDENIGKWKIVLRLESLDRGTA